MNDWIDVLAANRSDLARTIAETHFDRHPELRERYGAAGLAHCTADAAYHLQYLEQALRVRNDDLFADYARWAKIMLESRHIPAADLASNLATVADVAGEKFPALAASVRQTIDAGLRALETAAGAPDAGQPHAELAEAY